MNFEGEYSEDYNNLFKASEQTLIKQDLKPKSQKKKRSKKMKKKEILTPTTVKKLESSSTKKNNSNF